MVVSDFSARGETRALWQHGSGIVRIAFPQNMQDPDARWSDMHQVDCGDLTRYRL